MFHTHQSSCRTWRRRLWIC